LTHGANIMAKMRLENRTAVVTGAAGGIGRAIAVSLARRGCHLALADVNEAGLDETADMTTGRRVRISRHRLDVADRAAVAAFPAIVRAAHPGVDILVNNAGVAIAGKFDEVSEEDFEWLFGINFWGVVRMTRALLPLLRSSDDARIVNLSSVFGIVAPPGQTAYAASKFAVRGFSHALGRELQGSGVGVTVVHPGGVATSIARNARFPAGASAEDIARAQESARKALTLPPGTAGETIVKAVERRKPRVLVGSDANLISLIERLLPVSHWRMLNQLRARK
jgi:NAD(P)-dependent dehydrogenase (short-subunit alcohol dehydrogenase family)